MRKLKVTSISKSLFVTCLICAAFNSATADEIPDNYDSLSACAKQEVLWKEIRSTEHRALPELAELGVKEVGLMAIQSLTTKVARYSDTAPKTWRKYLHRRGVVSKVKFVASRDSEFTGLFKGADCGLVRLSLTYKPNKTSRDFAPGLALKLFRDKEGYSSNVSALYTLKGQEKDHNFFANALSNIVPMGDGFGLKSIHGLFKQVTGYPEQLLLTDFAESGADSVLVKERKAPRQLFFVPNQSVLSEKASSKPHDFRTDILKVKKGSLLYKVYAVYGKPDFNYADDYTVEMIEGFKDSASHIGDLITTSDFKASEFGDSRIFFRHEVRPKADD
jgi:hypothetical protein